MQVPTQPTIRVEETTTTANLSTGATPTKIHHLTRRDQISDDSVGNNS